MNINFCVNIEAEVLIELYSSFDEFLQAKKTLV